MSNMQLLHWITGPQIVGLLIFIVGCIQKYYPPKHINDLYGYRSETSKKNQQTWDEANRFSAILMIKMGVIALFIGLILIQLVSPKYEWIIATTTVVLGIGFAIILTFKTEKHLEKTFDNKVK